MGRHGHPSVSQPQACCPLTQEGPVTATAGSAPSFPGRSTVEPVALWLEMMIREGKLARMRRGWREVGLEEPWFHFGRAWI